MNNRRLRVFISSKMRELAPERETIKTALEDLHVEAWVFEKDAGARSQTIQETYLEELEAADLYIGVFWKEYGTYTIEEYENAQTLGMDCLLYEKREDVEEHRDHELQAFLDRMSEVESGLTINWFKTPEELGQFVKDDVAAWQAKIIREATRVSSTAIFLGIPSMPKHFSGREDLLLQMVHRLRAKEDLSLEGLPGIGKTTLAVALTYHPGVRRYFKDGTLWASLGQHPDVTIALRRWADALKTDISGRATVAERTQAVRDAIGQKRMLLVIDDIWDIDAATSLQCGGPNCAHILTTRNKEIARVLVGKSQTQAIPTLDDYSAFQLLQAIAPEACAAAPTKARALVREVGGLPVAIRLIGGFLAAPGGGMFSDLFPELSEEAFAEMTNPATRLKLAEERLGTLGDEQITLQDTIDLSLEALSDSDKRTFYDLSSFAPKPAGFDRVAAEAVTQASGATLSLLLARNLLDLDIQSKKISMHQVLHDFAETSRSEAATTRFCSFYLSIAQEKHSGKPFSLIEENYDQIKRAMKLTPESDALLRWQSALCPYFRIRDMREESLELSLRALNWATAKRLHKEEADLLVQISADYDALGQWQNAIEYGERAISLFEKAGDRRGTARLIHNLGVWLHKLGDDKRALKCLQDALVKLQSVRDGPGLQSCSRYLGNVHSVLGQTREARMYHLKADTFSIDLDSIPEIKTQVQLAPENAFSPPMWLALLTPFFNSWNATLSEEAPDLNGTLCIGVNRKITGKVFYLTVAFSSGQLVRFEIVEEKPRYWDAFAEANEDATEEMLFSSTPPVGAIRVHGDFGLFARIFQLLSDKDMVGMQKQELTLNRVRAFYELGRQFYATRQYAMAIDNFDQAIGILAKTGPASDKDAKAQQGIDYLLGSCFWRRGSAKFDVGNMEEAVSDLNKSVLLWLKLAESSELEEERIAEVHINLSAALYVRGKSLLEIGSNEEAVHDFSESIAMLTKTIEKRWDKGGISILVMALRERGMFFKTKDKLDDALKDLNRTVDIQLRSIEQEQQMPEQDIFLDLIEVANLLMQQGNFAEAARRLTSSIEIYDRSSKLGNNFDDKILITSLLGRAESFNALSAFEEELKDLDRLIEIHMAVHKQMKTEESAVTLMDNLIGRSATYEKMRMWPEAQQDLKRALAVGDELLRKLENSHGAVEVLPSKLTLILNGLAWLLATCSDDEIRDGAKAIGYAERACELTNWKNYEMCDTLAACYADLGDFKEALRWQSKAIELCEALGDKAIKEDLESRQKLYQQGQQYLS